MGEHLKLKDKSSQISMNETYAVYEPRDSWSQFSTETPFGLLPTNTKKNNNPEFFCLQQKDQKNLSLSH